MRRVADTSFLYAAFDAADARHAKARDELAKAQALDVPLAVLAEFVDLVAYRQGRKVAVATLKALLALPTVGIRGLQHEEQAVALWANRDGISMVDAVGIQACLEHPSRLVSYDKRQAALLAALRRKAGRA